MKKTKVKGQNSVSCNWSEVLAGPQNHPAENEGVAVHEGDSGHLREVDPATKHHFLPPPFSEFWLNGSTLNVKVVPQNRLEGRRVRSVPQQNLLRPFPLFLELLLLRLEIFLKFCILDVIHMWGQSWKRCFCISVLLKYSSKT